MGPSSPLRAVLLLAAITVTVPALAQEADWVEIDSFEESYILSPQAESVTFDDRTYRYEVGGTRDYAVDTRLVVQVWSAEFQPMVMVREARSDAGRAGHGAIVVQGQNRMLDDNGTPYYLSELQFMPPEDGPYRLVITSVETLSSKEPSTGRFNVAWTLEEWREPEPAEPAPEPQVAEGVGCGMSWGRGMSPSETGLYGVWTRDSLDLRLYDITIRVAEGPVSQDRAQDMIARGIDGAYPGEFVGMLSGQDICQYVADRCTAAEGFTATCEPFGFAAMPERRASR